MCRTCGLITQWEQGMGAHLPLIHAVIAKSPVSFVADLAAPIALVRPG